MATVEQILADDRHFQMLRGPPCQTNVADEVFFHPNYQRIDVAEHHVERDVVPRSQPDWM